MGVPLIFPSAEEMEASYQAQAKDFKLLNEDFYILQITSIEVQANKASQYQEAHDEWKVSFEVISFQNGEPLYYADGSEPDPSRPVKLTAFINPTKVGFFPKVAKARKFITAALGVEAKSRIELNSYEDLVGKRLVGRVIHKPDSKGVTRDRLEDFLALRKRPQAPVAKPTTEEVEADADALLAKAQEIFGEDLKV